MPEPIIQKALDREESRMKLAVQVVIGNVKRLLNRSNRSGKHPSAPGEPPRKVFGRLQGSIVGKTERTRDSVIGIVGSNLKSARRLELGFVGRDVLGRVIDQKPRPYLRPGLAQSLDKVRRILGAKK